MAKRSNKRERLIEAARKLFYQQGFGQTTIAQIASLASVPLGNVYYYFKTKDEICETVIDADLKEAQALIKILRALGTHKERLQAMLDYFSERAEDISHYGNIFSGLAQELSKQRNPLAEQAKIIVSHMLAFVEEQLEPFFSNKAEVQKRALQFFAGLQGIQFLTTAYQDPNITVQQVKVLGEWLSELKTAA
jgi:AcrR family transcriptional regulator